MKKLLFQNVRNSAYAQLSALFGGLVTSVIVARELGAEERGVMAGVLLGPAVILALTANGIVAPITHFVSSKQWKKEDIFKYVWALWIIVLAVIIFVVSVSFLLWNDFILGFKPSLILLVCVMLPLTLTEQALKYVLAGFQEYKKIKNIVFIQAAQQVFVILLLWYFSKITVVSVISLQVVVMFVGIISAYYLIRKKEINVFIRPLLDRNRLKPCLSYGIKSHVANLAQFFNYKIDQFLIALYLGAASLGVYTVGVQLVEKLWLVTRDISGVLLSTVSGNQDNKETAAVVLGAGKIGLYVTVAAAVGLSILVYAFCEFIYGVEYIDMIFPILILMPGIVALSLCKIIASYLAGIGRPELNMRASLISLGFNLIISFSLIPTYGLIGAAIGTSIAHFCATIYVIIVFLKITGFKLKRLLWISKSDMSYCRSVYDKIRKKHN